MSLAGLVKDVLELAPLLIHYTPIPQWWTLTLLASLYYLAITREQLFTHNLFDSYDFEQQDLFTGIHCSGASIAYRTFDGSCNNLQMPEMGMLGYRFGRNIPLQNAFQDTANLLEPNPRLVATKLLHREEFVPGTTLNLLAAAWIQFQVHDWFNHGRDLNGSDPILVPLPADDPWRPGMDTINIARTVNDVRNGDNKSMPITYPNENTHWWDLSQVYGVDPAVNKRLRTFQDGKLYLDQNGLLPVDTDGLEVTGLKFNWWIGLVLMHTIWTKEHNSVCDYLKAAHPEFDDDQLFNTARLVTTALNAKIHTIEWTPAILDNESLYIGMNANWYGLANMVPAIWKPAIVELAKIFPMYREALTGIVGQPPDFYGVPFSLTEEFVSVYRFHSLLPDEISIVNSSTGNLTGVTYPTINTTYRYAPKVVRAHSLEDLFATFGTANPGALTLGNYPKFLTDFSIPIDPVYRRIDMSTTDIIRDRERGVPRYNQFRRLLSLTPARNFSDINSDPAVVAKLMNVYDDIEKVDLLVGCLAEQPRPPKWGFGDTEFQIFLLMASRRLLTDRFLTTDYTAEFYTKEGLQWIENSNFRTVIGRHLPQLSPYLASVNNAFFPWSKN